MLADAKLTPRQAIKGKLIKREASTCNHPLKQRYFNHPQGSKKSICRQNEIEDKDASKY